MPRRRHAGLEVRTDRLLTMDVGDVVEATPVGMRQEKGRLWRGASVAALALKLATGDFTLNPSQAHVGRGHGFNVSYNYLGARYYATQGGHFRQFRGPDRQRLAEATGATVPDGFIGPGILFSFDDVPRAVATTTEGVAFVRERVPFSAMDSHSLAALEELLEVEIPQDQGSSLPSALRSFLGHLAGPPDSP